jgi:short-subunit dehydrogenase
LGHPAPADATAWCGGQAGAGEGPSLERGHHPAHAARRPVPPFGPDARARAGRDPPGQHRRRAAGLRPLDALVNNAGIGLLGAFEATPMSTVREVFETNTFGVLAMTQAVLPGFRSRRSGVVVNVTSSATLAPMPLVAVYTASKAAIEGFTGSLAHELAPFGVRAKLLEPGCTPTTRFTENGMPSMQGLIPEGYAQSVFEAFGTQAAFTRETDVAEAMWQAVNDTTGRLRFAAGADAVALAEAPPR